MILIFTFLLKQTVLLSILKQLSIMKSLQKDMYINFTRKKNDLEEIWV